MWLIALLDEEEYDSSFFAFETVKSTVLNTTTSGAKSKTVSSKLATGIDNTVEFNKLMKLKEEELKKEEEKARKIAERKAMLTAKDTELLKIKEQKKNAEDEYKKKLRETVIVKGEEKTKLLKAQAELKELEVHKLKIAHIFYNLKQAERVDMCFLLDCTLSMRPYITQTKLIIHEIVDKLKKMFSGFSLRLALVGYTDHCNEERIVFRDFDSDVDKFKTFVSSIKNANGHDICEDVFGGRKIF